MMVDILKNKKHNNKFQCLFLVLFLQIISINYSNKVTSILNCTLYVEQRKYTSILILLYTILLYIHYTRIYFYTIQRPSHYVTCWAIIDCSATRLCRDRVRVYLRTSCDRHGLLLRATTGPRHGHRRLRIRHRHLLPSASNQRGPHLHMGVEGRNAGGCRCWGWKGVLLVDAGAGGEERAAGGWRCSGWGVCCWWM